MNRRSMRGRRVVRKQASVGMAVAQALEPRRLLATVLSEGFEGSFPSAWMVGDSNTSGTPAYWGGVDSAFGGETPYAGSKKGYCAAVGYGGTTSAPTYQSSMTAYMSRSISLAGYGSASLSFWYRIPAIESGNYDHLRVYISTSRVFDVSSAVTSWTQASIDVSAYAGASFTLKFEFYSDSTGTAEGAYLDDIFVTAASVAAPTGVVASDGAYPDKVRVTWTASAGATAYEVWRNTSSASSSATLLAGNVVGTTYDDMSATASQGYYYWVKAKAADGTSGFSASDSGFVMVAPAAPTGVVASDGAYPDKVRVTWTASAGATAYEVWRGTGTSQATNISGDGVVGTTFDDTSAVVGTTYYYWVKAKNAAGESVLYGGNAGYLMDTPAAPIGVAASHGTYTDRVRISWSAPPMAAGFEVWRSGSDDNSTAVQITGSDVTGTSYDDTDVVGGTVYYYWVRAKNVVGTSAFSAGRTGYVMVVPAAPTGVSATDGVYSDRVRVTWTAADMGSGYEVWRSTVDDSSTATRVADYNVIVTSHDDMTVSASTPYYYWVKAKNAVGTSGLSSADTGYRLPKAPTGVTASDGTYPEWVRIAWTASADATAYEVWRSVSNSSDAAVVIASDIVGTTYDDGSPEPGAVYYYWVKATNDGRASAFSASNAGSKMPLPSVPTGVSASNGTYTNKVVVSWTAAANATGYEVWRSTSNDSSTASPLTASPVTGTTYEDTSAAVEQRYFYWVRGASVAGYSALSTSDEGYATRLPFVPAGLSATDGSSANNVSLSWSSTTNATAYEVWRSTENNSGSASLVAQVSGTTWEDTTVAPNGVYYYWVRGKNSYGTGGYSAAERGYAATILYVDDSAAGTGDGLSWANAITDLRAAMVLAGSGCEIRVAAGVYKPTTTTDRTVSFVLKNGVAVVGGYAGNGAADPDARDTAAFGTVLSGDIGATGVSSYSDNSYHVITGTSITSTAILDGVTIRDGYANGATPASYGAGMYLSAASPTIRNSVFTANYASSGGGIYCAAASSPSITNCTFTSNKALGNGNLQGGGAIFNSSSSPQLASCTFSANEATYNGGGMYNSSSSPTLTNCIFSANRAGMTFGSNGGAGMYNSNSTPRLTSCTFDGNQSGSASASKGGGMYNSTSSPILIGCVFSANWAAGGGGGMYNYDASSPTVTGTTFLRNTGENGGGVLNAASSSSTIPSPTFTNCTFNGNVAFANGGGLGNGTYGSSTLANCTFSQNWAVNGGAIYVGPTTSGSVTATNCTFVGNAGGNAIHVQRASALTLRNSIVWGSRTPIADNSTAQNVTYSDIQGGYPGTGNHNVDPQFVRSAWAGPDWSLSTADDDYGDLRLQAGSPALDIGSNAAAPVGTDIAGNPRIQNGTVDLGAYEGETAVVARTIYVDAAAEGAGTGASWNDAYTSLQAALIAATDGDTIRVADGTYKPDAAVRKISFVLRSGVSLYGGYAGSGAANPDARDIALYATILSGDIGTVGSKTDNSYRVVTSSGLSGSEVFDGFTITDGNANDYDSRYTGGGMYNSSSLTISNCTFIGNSADSGGGLVNAYSSPRVINCTFTGNTAKYGGGGVYNYSSSPVIINSVISGNSAAFAGGLYDYTSSSPTVVGTVISRNSVTSSGGGVYNSDASTAILSGCIITGNIAGTDGGGVYNYEDSSISLVNSVLAGNSAARGGAVYADWYSPVSLTNCTISGNVATTGSALYASLNSTPTLTGSIAWGNGSTPFYAASTSTPVITYSDIEGGYAGDGNISADPMFIRALSAGADGALGTADDDYGDLRVRLGSPVIDAGNNAAAGLAGVTTDAAGTPRFLDIATISDTGVGTAPVVDMGAYEFDGPSDIVLSASTVLENRPTGTVVGTFMTSDPSVGDTFTYVLVEGEGAADNSVFAAVGDQLLTAGTFDYEARSSYSIRVRTTDARGSSYEKVLSIAVGDVDEIAPSVSAVLINDGAAQRSMVRKVAVVFSEPVILAPGALMVPFSDGTWPGNIAVMTGNPSGDQRTYVLSFFGAGATGGSLPDGIYDLLVNASGVQDQTGNVMTASYTQRFHRLFGDSDGNKIVNALDYARLKNSFARSAADPLFNSAFDYEGNNLINALDLARFRQRYGLAFSY